MLSPILTLDKIEKKIKNNDLPKSYRIKAPCDIDYEKLILCLSLFTSNRKMLKFINIISKTSNVALINYGKRFVLNITEFATAYAKNNLFAPEFSEEKQNILLDHFKRNICTKNQIAYILKNVTNLTYRKLFDHCFNKNLLFALAQDYNHITSFPTTISRALYRYLNPEHKLPSPTPILDMYYETARTAHVLGLSDPITFQVHNRKYVIDQNGEYNEPSLDLLIEGIDAYRQNFPSNEINTIFTAFKTCHAQFESESNSYKPNAAYELLHQYQKDQLTYLSIGWEKEGESHSEGIVFFKNFVIHCNRGFGGDDYFGSKIYAINEPKIIDMALFQKLTKEFNSSEDLSNFLNTIVNLNLPLFKFRSKPQQHGTCSYVNPKATIEGMIVLVQAGPHPTFDTLNAIYQQEYKRKKYKHLTTFIRNREIDELLKKMSQATHPDLVHFFAALVKSIIQQHHGKDRGYIKDRQENDRAVKLFKNVPDCIRMILEQDPSFLALMNQVNTKYQTSHKQKTFLPGYEGNKVRQQGNVEQLIFPLKKMTLSL